MSSDFSEFLNQSFMRTMLPLMCIVTLLLIATIAAIVYMRRRKAEQARNDLPAVPGYVTASDFAASAHDMPDLNLLVHTPAAPPVPPAKRVEPAPTAPAAAAPIRQARKGTFTVTPRDGSSTEAVEVLTILRDVVDGRLIVQMGDKALHNVNSDAEFKERFGKLMRELGQLVKSAPPVAARAVEVMPPADMVGDSEASTESSEMPLPDETHVQMPKKAPVPAVPPGVKLPGDLPSFKLEDNPMQKLKRWQKADLAPVPEINIAGAIETYLQHKKSLSPEFAGRNIHIYPAPGGGVSIEVDGTYYEAVSDVSDAAVREFLSETINEWQERH